MKYELVKTTKLKNWPNNPRFIKDAKYKQLLKSIQAFPEMLEARPLVINKKFEVLGGNMRLRACKELDIKEIPCIQVDYTEDRQKEFVIKDNISHGDWDWDMLANEWKQEVLIDWGIDSYNFGTGSDLLLSEDIDDGAAIDVDNLVKPTAATEGFVKLEIVMQEAHKKELVKLLNEYQVKKQVNMGEALYQIAVLKLI